MKYLISIFIAFLSGILYVTGQKSYYYCEGQKIPLTPISNEVIITIPYVNNSLKFSSGITVIRSIKGEYDTKYICKATPMALQSPSSGIPVNSFVEPVYMDGRGDELAPTGYMHINLKKAEDYTLLQEVARQYNLIIVEEDTYMPLWYLLRRGPNCQRLTLDIINEIHESRQFESCSPEFSFTGMLDMSYDTYIQNQWALFNSTNDNIDISINSAWDYATGRGIKVALVDTGVDLTHEDLIQNIYMSYDCITESSPSKIYTPHGTKCAGTIAAVRNNGKGIAGVAPDAKLMVVSTDTTGNEVYDKIAKGICWAYKNGADIISLSLTIKGSSAKISKAIDKAFLNGRNGKGCIVVTSAGNQNKTVTYPGYLRKDILAIGSINNAGIRRSDSCFGDSLFLMAPGDQIFTTFPNNEYGYYNGTSAACPHVSGVAALILERNPALTHSQVREILGKSTKKVGNLPYNVNNEFGKWNKYYGYGLIDAYKAVLNTPRQ